MIDQKKRTVRFETSSLLPLKLVLIEAEKDLPARAPKEHDVNEELALKLITSMKKEYRKVHVIARSASCDEAISSIVMGIASGYCPRNDIQLEP